MLTKFVLFLLVLLFNFILVFGALTEKQMKSTAKLMRNNCQPKHKVSDEEIDNMHKGIWNEDPAAKCYIYCQLVFLKLVNKSGEIDFESGAKQIQTLPSARQEPTLKSFETCKDQVGNSGDKCDPAWKMARCFYFDNPENYFLA